MNEIKLEEKFDNATDKFFNENLFEGDYTNTQLTQFQSEIALENIPSINSEEYLDKLLTAIKFAFLYIPGTMAINMVGMFAYVLILYSESMPNFFAELSGFTLIGTFLTMLGIGKLKDLNYLKVPAVVFAASVLYSIIHAIFAMFLGDGIFGFFFLTSFPIVALVGYLVKKVLDKNQ